MTGTRIVIPSVLQQRAIDIAHESHLGIEKTKSLMREKIWFPQIDSRVKDTIEQCVTCQAVGKPQPPEPAHDINAKVTMDKSTRRLLWSTAYVGIPLSHRGSIFQIPRGRDCAFDPSFDNHSET